MAKRSAPKTDPYHPLKMMFSALGSLVRWRILSELAQSGSLPASEVGRRLSISPNAASKHLREMLDAGVLHRGFGKLYSIPPQFVAGPSLLDFGAFTIRIDQMKASPRATISASPKAE